MPVVSEAQRRYMEMIAHGGKPRNGKGPSKKVAKEFIKATPKGAKLPQHASKR